MRKQSLWIFIGLLFCLPLPVFGTDIISELDALHDSMTLKNYEESIRLCQQALEKNSKDIHLLWRCARAYRWYGEVAKRREVDNWKKICAEYGKKGMLMAQKVIDLAPDKPDGYLWYGYNVGIYSDGVSILKALKEGLKNKTQESFQKAYKLDKMYEDAGSILALGRFWFVLPWPLSDKDLSLKYLREYQKTEFYGVHPEGPIYLAELLIDMGSDENEAEAKSVLTQTLKTDNKYFLDWRDRLLKDLN